MKIIELTTAADKRKWWERFGQMYKSPDFIQVEDITRRVIDPSFRRFHIVVDNQVVGGTGIIQMLAPSPITGEKCPTLCIDCSWIKPQYRHKGLLTQARHLMIRDYGVEGVQLFFYRAAALQHYFGKHYGWTEGCIFPKRGNSGETGVSSIIFICSPQAQQKLQAWSNIHYGGTPFFDMNTLVNAYAFS